MLHEVVRESRAPRSRELVDIRRSAVDMRENERSPSCDASAIALDPSATPPASALDDDVVDDASALSVSTTEPLSHTRHALTSAEPDTPTYKPAGHPMHADAAAEPSADT